MKTVVDRYRDYCNDMKFFEILDLLQNGYSLKFCAKSLNIPYSRTRIYAQKLSEFHRLCSLQNNPDSIVNLDINYKDFLKLESMRIKTISRLRSLLSDPLSRVDFNRKLLGNCRLALDEYDN